MIATAMRYGRACRLHAKQQCRRIRSRLVDEHRCPVCGYALAEPAWTPERGGSFEICPSCGIQFGYTSRPAATPSEGVTSGASGVRDGSRMGCPGGESASRPTTSTRRSSFATSADCRVKARGAAPARRPLAPSAGDRSSLRRPPRRIPFGSSEQVDRALSEWPVPPGVDGDDESWR
jgi:hypothetical protein